MEEDPSLKPPLGKPLAHLAILAQTFHTYDAPTELMHSTWSYIRSAPNLGLTGRRVICQHPMPITVMACDGKYLYFLSGGYELFIINLSGSGVLPTKIDLPKEALYMCTSDCMEGYAFLIMMDGTIFRVDGDVMSFSYTGLSMQIDHRVLSRRENNMHILHGTKHLMVPVALVRNPLRIIALPQKDAPLQSVWRDIYFPGNEYGNVRIGASLVCSRRADDGLEEGVTSLFALFERTITEYKIDTSRAVVSRQRRWKIDGQLIWAGAELSFCGVITPAFGFVMVVSTAYHTFMIPTDDNEDLVVRGYYKMSMSRGVRVVLPKYYSPCGYFPVGARDSIYFPVPLNNGRKYQIRKIRITTQQLDRHFVAGRNQPPLPSEAFQTLIGRS